MVTYTTPVEYEGSIADQEQLKTLEEHFHLFYQIQAANRLIPEASFECIRGIHRCLSGIQVPYHNCVIGCPDEEEDQWIEQQLAYFEALKMPFVWYVDELANPGFKEKLLHHGFQNVGVFQGVIGRLDQPIPSPELPSDYRIELVQDEEVLNEFNELVCHTFGIQRSNKELFKKVLWHATKSVDHPMFHWVARKRGRVVSALTTLFKGDSVSFWNGASIPELRRQGLSTALRRSALQHAVAHGCRLGTSYLMSEGLAYGICAKLGYKTKWRFHAFLAPIEADK